MKKSFVLYISLTLLFTNVAVFAADRLIKSADTTLVFIPDDPIVAMMDSLMHEKYFESKNFTTDTCKLNKLGYCAEVIPTFDDIIYEARLNNLDAKSPFGLVYSNAVRSYIDLYAVRKRNIVSRMIGMSQIYFPLFEEMLDKYKLPMELKYLAIVESALNPNAISKSGAAGLWQFMYGTGKMFGLDVNSYVDERRDPYKATEAACKYFRFLYNIFGDWQMVLAAYNGGPGTVNKAIRRSGGKRTYWEIRPYLPLETQGYVPAFIAVNYVMNYTAEHNLYPISPKQIYFHTDTVATRQQVNFTQISKVLDVPMDDIEYLNPQYKLKVIPYFGEQAMLCLPAGKVGAFINNENSIYSYKTPQEKMDSLLSNTTQIVEEVQKIHKVRKGETLKQIAHAYACNVGDLKNWNNIRGNKVATGKRLIVYVKKYKNVSSDIVKSDADTTAVAAANSVRITSESKIENADSTDKNGIIVGENNTNSKSFSDSKTKAKFIYYTVQRGDTLWNIATRKGVSIEDIKKLNNIKSSSSLKAGSRIKIAVAG